jgi:NitT/TauT family transport system ATP-binding protein
MIKIDDLSLSYDANGRDRFRVLDNIQLELPNACYTTIVGPSGSGKSTFLRCLSGILQPDTENIRLDDCSPGEQLKQHNIGFVFQKAVFFEWKNIMENVALPVEIAGNDNGLELARKYLDAFGLTAFIDAFPHELSGGMLARAALARALVNDPAFIFLDEAFNNLDEALRDVINDIVQRVSTEYTKTIVAVMHDISEAVFLSDIVLVMRQRPTNVYKAVEINLPRPRKREIKMLDTFLAIVETIRMYLHEVYND